MRRLVLGLAAGLLLRALLAASPDAAAEVQFVFFSDVHYGLARPVFRGGTQVDAAIVNAAMAARINEVPAATFAKDGGVRGAQIVGPIDFLAVGGDIANRSDHTEAGNVQSPAVSWAQSNRNMSTG